MFPTNGNPVSDLVFTGVGSIAMALAASLLDRPYFAAVFTFFGAFAISIAICERGTADSCVLSAHEADFSPCYISHSGGVQLPPDRPPMRFKAKPAPATHPRRTDPASAPLNEPPRACGSSRRGRDGVAARSQPVANGDLGMSRSGILR
jgi:hypothetical protein